MMLRPLSQKSVHIASTIQGMTSHNGLEANIKNSRKRNSRFDTKQQSFSNHLSRTINTHKIIKIFQVRSAEISAQAIHCESDARALGRCSSRLLTMAAYEP